MQGCCIGLFMSAMCTHQFYTHGTHSKASFKKDFELVVKDLSEKSKVLKHLSGKRRDSFKSLEGSMLKIEKAELIEWMKYTLKSKYRFCYC